MPACYNIYIDSGFFFLFFFCTSSRCRGKATFTDVQSNSSFKRKYMRLEVAVKGAHLSSMLCLFFIPHIAVAESKG